MGAWSPAPPGRRFVGEQLTIPGVLDARTAERPEQPLIVIADEPFTYLEIQARSVAAANSLSRLGIAAGDRVAIFMGTSPDWVALWFGVARLGAVAVPINTAYRGDFLAHQLRQSRTKLVAVDRSLWPRVAAVAGELPDLHTVLVRDDGTPQPEDPAPPSGPALLDLDVVWEGERDRLLVPTGVAYDRPGAIFYTSGTTGPSKGALASNHYLMTAAQTMLDCWRLEEGEVMYAPLPLFHLSAVGSVLGPMLAGGTGVLEKAFSVHAFWDQVRRYQAAGVALAGAMVTMLWNLEPDERDAEVPMRFMSAAPVEKEIYLGIEERYRCRIVTAYGMSEAFPLSYTAYGVDNPPGASGRLNPDFDVAIFDDEDREVPPGTVGEIVCRPRRRYVMFDGYDGREADTLAQLRNLWFHTGDLGRVDADGNLAYADRKKDAMRRRGENISSFEVEQALARHPAVAEVAAIGVPSDLGEDDVMVCLVARPGTEIEVEPFMDFCCERLPYFAVPRYVDVMAELPKNAVGRVLKHELRARGVTDDTWDRETAGYAVTR
ncbi:MAG TPA: AMP-binding protein [Acidimicrobiales bacterium]|nr:AMP-binding protein [Acidimicrobiales bacterium]